MARPHGFAMTDDAVDRQDTAIRRTPIVLGCINTVVATTPYQVYYW